MTGSADHAIETRGLRKVFGAVEAVRGLTLTVKRGEIFGFLGPNGAGKSTSLKMLLGLVRPSGGEAFLLGAASSDVAVRRRVGFLPEDFRFYDWLTAAELLHFHGRLAGLPSARLRTRVPEVLDLVGLAPHRDRRLHGFSKGMLQRVGLAQALVHEPDVVLLDEPTSGLDPMGRRLVRDILRAERERGATVFLNSHLLSEIEVTCDRVAFMRDGQVVAEHDLHAAARGEVGVVVRAGNVSTDAVEGLRRWASDPRYQDGQVTFRVRSEDALPEIVRHLVAAGADVYSCTPERQSLEEMFVKIMGEDRGL